jgi:hypothetical protein
MKWSFSASKAFASCPRKWFFSEVMARPRTKDPLAREAYLLKQLQSIYAWRGNLVDKVISDFVKERLLKNEIPSLEETIGHAMSLADRQITFGKEKGHKTPGMTKSLAGDKYCAFYEIEYDGAIADHKLETARGEISAALSSLLGSDLIKYIANENEYIVTQRQLRFDFAGVHISCTPDFIAFFKDDPPMVIDWKVHSFANTDYRTQLGIYGIALSRIDKPHSDFPARFRCEPEEMRLTEYQLLKNDQRRYSLGTDSVLDIEDYMYHSITQMQREIDQRPIGTLSYTHFRTANFADTCSRCKFKRLCVRSLPTQKLLFEVI